MQMLVVRSSQHLIRPYTKIIHSLGIDILPLFLRRSHLPKLLAPSSQQIFLSLTSFLSTIYSHNISNKLKTIDQVSDIMIKSIAHSES